MEDIERSSEGRSERITCCSDQGSSRYRLRFARRAAVSSCRSFNGSRGSRQSGHVVGMGCWCDGCSSVVIGERVCTQPSEKGSHRHRKEPKLG